MQDSAGVLNNGLTERQKKKIQIPYNKTTKIPSTNLSYISAHFPNAGKNYHLHFTKAEIVAQTNCMTDQLYIACH